MYPGEHARLRPDQPAVIMAGSGETLIYGELERRSNRLAHLLRANGLRRLDHYAVFMENNIRFCFRCVASGTVACLVAAGKKKSRCPVRATGNSWEENALPKLGARLHRERSPRRSGSLARRISSYEKRER